MKIKSIIKDILLNFGYKLSKLDYSKKCFSSKKDIHFIHIGRNAGSEIVERCEQLNKILKEYRIVPHSHETKLKNLDQRVDFFFSVRSPDIRFESAFYMLRDQSTRKFTVSEEVLFGSFSSANDLAEALFSESEKGGLAYQLMNTVYHFSATQHSFFQHSSHFDLNPPFVIIRQEFLEDDWNFFTRKLKISNRLLSHIKPKVSNHRKIIPKVELSKKALKNLSKWYAKDWYFYNYCCKIQESNLKNEGKL
jgi:hypothetical protein